MTAKILTLTEALNAAATVIPNEVLRNIVVTRIFVRTGVNLRDIQPQQDDDAKVVDEMILAFEELGYPLAGGQP